jgi:hypothetical protein
MYYAREKSVFSAFFAFSTENTTPRTVYELREKLENALMYDISPVIFSLAGLSTVCYISVP